MKIDLLLSLCEGYPNVVLVYWRPCTASLFTIYSREVHSEVEKRYSSWNAVNVSKYELSYALNLACRTEYEIAVTAWNSTAETPLTAANDSELWKVKTSEGNYRHKHENGTIEKLKA